MVAVEKTRGVTTRVRFLPTILTSLGSKSGTLFYLNHRNRVNTILTLGHEFAFARGYGAWAWMRRANTRGTVAQHPILDSTELLNTGDRSPEIFRRVKSTASAEAWGAALRMAPTSVLASVVASRLPTPLL